ncbi:MAG TPA: hypothetical protein PKC80_04555 [Burkholderiaceae bacterium]|nr:hypothetical protein [Burkholderiaceae bacterium]
MLRLAVLLLILANGLYFAWSHQIFSELGWGKIKQNEPHRLHQQINPERIRVLEINELPDRNKPAYATSTNVATSVTTSANVQCMQTGNYNDKQVEQLRSRLSALMPSSSWRFVEIATQPYWLIYMGQYANSNMFELKKAELKKMQLPFTPINQGPMALGISLGRYPSQADANQSLNALNKRGIRTAKVVQDVNPDKTYQLVFPAIGSELIPKINALTLTVAGKPLQSCIAKP